jgi:hypothetical protein
LSPQAGSIGSPDSTSLTVSLRPTRWLLQARACVSAECRGDGSVHPCPQDCGLHITDLRPVSKYAARLLSGCSHCPPIMTMPQLENPANPGSLASTPTCDGRRTRHWFYHQFSHRGCSWTIAYMPPWLGGCEPQVLWLRMGFLKDPKVGLGTRSS